MLNLEILDKVFFWKSVVYTNNTVPKIPVKSMCLRLSFFSKTHLGVYTYMFYVFWLPAVIIY